MKSEDKARNHEERAREMRKVQGKIRKREGK